MKERELLIVRLLNFVGEDAETWEAATRAPSPPASEEPGAILLHTVGCFSDTSHLWLDGDRGHTATACVCGE